MDSGEMDRMQVLESRFDLNDRRVWFGRAKLLPDRMMLRGIGYQRRIMLADIVEVRWAADELVIVLRDGDEVDMTIRSAALWKYELQARCGLKDASQANVLPDAGPRTPKLSTSAAPVAPPSADQVVVNVPEGDGLASSEPEVGQRPDAEDKIPGSQTDMFLERESTYRIRGPFADDRPGRDPRTGDPAN
ncbi:MAG: hypothetical protein O3C45_00015 [Bacteroidetes bacterium]|nr:hypothetical protein [Bacteroidota bacterium]MDA0873426.1 hypothetical protein [Bacteroidota bacterium]